MFESKTKQPDPVSYMPGAAGPILKHGWSILD